MTSAATANDVNAVLLVGPPGSGKSSVGRELAKLLQWQFVDLDDVIEKRCGRSVQKIFAERGEPEFRRLETQTLEQLSTEGIAQTIIATGGGIIATKGNFELMKQIGRVICLTATVQSLAARLRDDATRPLLNRDGAATDAEAALTNRLTKLLDERQQFYDLPDMKVSTDGKPPVDIANKIAETLGLL